MIKKILKILLAIILVLILIVGGYIIYLQVNYYRIEDNFELTIENNPTIVYFGNSLPGISAIVGHCQKGVSQ